METTYKIILSNGSCLMYIGLPLSAALAAFLAEGRKESDIIVIFLDSVKTPNL